MRESRLEKDFVKWVKELGGDVRKVAWVGRRGAPDRLVLHPDQPPVLVEMKAPGKPAKAHQVREHKRLNDCNFKTVVIDSYKAAYEFLIPYGIAERHNRTGEAGSYLDRYTPELPDKES